MKRSVLALLIAVCLFPAAAQARTSYSAEARLAGPASRIAGQPVEVRCYQHDEPDDPLSIGAWGYVYPNDPVEYMAAEVCAGALGIADNSAPQWMQALGALVLAHESYHLALRYRNRTDEAWTECRAIRHFRYMVMFLGGTPEQATALLPWGLALHWRIAALAPVYNLDGCKVPNPY